MVIAKRLLQITFLSLIELNSPFYPQLERQGDNSCNIIRHHKLWHNTQVTNLVLGSNKRLYTTITFPKLKIPPKSFFDCGLWRLCKAEEVCAGRVRWPLVWPVTDILAPSIICYQHCHHHSHHYCHHQSISRPVRGFIVHCIVMSLLML